MLNVRRPISPTDLDSHDRDPGDPRPEALPPVSPEVPAAILERAGTDRDQFETEYDRTGDAPVERAVPTEGAICDPDRLPANVPAGWACQFSGAWEEQLRPARIMNARKGDILLSPGGDGVIGGFLRQVSPPQRYAHALICTEDQVEVAHVVGASDWLKDQHTGGLWRPPFTVEPAPSDGLRPDALKYIWPGGIIQSAEEAVAGSEFKAPEGAPYRLTGLSQTGFARFEDGWEAVPPLVLKPAPDQETAAVRAGLHRVAEIAREHCITADDSRAGRFSKLHYRLFCYTDATIDTPAPAGESWFAGTLPAVCSSFVWLMARRAGIRRFQGVTAGDISTDDLSRPEVPDGLSHYSPDERAKAAQWLHDHYRTHVREHLRQRTGFAAVAWLWDRASDMANDLSNQVLNAFAHDWTETKAKDSRRWHDEPRPGVAVSPDDLRRWPGPEEGGWGAAEPLVYRSSRPELVPVHTWRRVTGRGTLTGLVRFGGVVAPGTRIKVGGQDLMTDAAGVFRVELAAGDYIVDAGRLVEGAGYVEARVPVTVTAGRGETVTILLREPSDVFRRVVIQAVGRPRNQGTSESEHGEAVGFRRELDVQPWHSRETWTWTAELDDEVHVELACTASVRFDRSVEVRLEGAFSEMDDEARVELEMPEARVLTIAPGASETCQLSLWTEDRRDPGDYLELSITITNERQP